MDRNKIQKRIADYPKKIMAIQNIYETIPDIKALSETYERIDRANDSRELLKRNLKLLKGYEISLDAVIENYSRIRGDIGEDIKELKKEESDESISLSIIQAEQLILSVEGLMRTVRESYDAVRNAEESIGKALE